MKLGRQFHPTARWLALIFLLMGGARLDAFARGGALTNLPVEFHPQLWQIEDGLPMDAVQTLLQTSDGYVWVGTGKGLARFDGVRFTVFDSQNTPEIKNSSISSLCQTADGSLWIGTGAGLTRLKAGKFSYCELAGGPRANDIKVIFESHDGSLWVGTLEGLFHYENGDWQRFLYGDGLTDSVIRSLAEKNGALYIGTASGLNVRVKKEVHRVDAASVRSIRAIYKDVDGTIWLGLGIGLARLTEDGKLVVYAHDQGLPDPNISAIYRDKRGIMWVGSYSGLSQFENGRFTVMRDSLGGYFEQVNSIMEDSEGDIWVGTREGLHELRVKRFTAYTRADGLSQNNVMSLLEDRKGVMWLTTYFGGLARLDTNGITNFDYNRGTNGLHSAKILGMFEDRDGTLIVGTDHDGGTYRWDGKLFKRIYNYAQASNNPVARVVYRDRQENLWIGAQTGLLLCVSNRLQKVLKNVVPRCILEGHDGTLWVGTLTGLYSRTNGTFTEWRDGGNSFHETVLALHEDKEHALWIGTASSGLRRLKDGRFTTYNIQKGLFSDDIYEILEDDRGWLWIGCSRGIYRVSKSNLDDLDNGKTKTINNIIYGKRDGLESVQCSAMGKPGAWKSHDGRLWFATAKGAVVTDPNVAIDSNQRPPPVKIEKVVADKQRFEIWRDEGAVLRIPPGSHDLEFHYTALSFQAPEKMWFKYKLEGVDTEWREVTRRQAFYSNVRPGKYRFRVKACNNNGVWSETEATLSLVLAPQFWQTWWFMGSAGIFAIAFAGGTVRYTTRRNMEAELRRLEKQHAIEEERIRIARDMHDEIGAKLTKISFLGASAKRKLSAPEEAGGQIEQMSQTARDVIRALDEIVWAVNPANDTLEHLVTYLCRNATEFFENSPITCQLKIPDDLPPVRLGTDVRHNLLLAAKEAMNNALKHSQAANVTVGISVHGDKLEVVVADNGCGLAAGPKTDGALAARTKRAGNGLTNMHDRLAAIGGHCSVTSAKGQGTRIVFTIDLKG